MLLLEVLETIEVTTLNKRRHKASHWVLIAPTVVYLVEIVCDVRLILNFNSQTVIAILVLLLEASMHISIIVCEVVERRSFSVCLRGLVLLILCPLVKIVEVFISFLVLLRLKGNGVSTFHSLLVWGMVKRLRLNSRILTEIVLLFHSLSPFPLKLALVLGRSSYLALALDFKVRRMVLGGSIISQR